MSATIMIGQGDVFGSERPCVISTILGSCVAVCLYDDQRRIGGMNHFVVPAPLGDDEADTRCGEHAVTSLIEHMLALGCSPFRLKAKIFGGAVPPWVEPGSRFAIGTSNVGIARDTLARHGVPIVAERTGGSDGYKIYFETASGDVYVQPIRRPS
jgi:chemotaxis protein CheD